MGNKEYKDRNTLVELYHNQGMSMEGVAQELKTTSATISRYMDKFDIPTRDKGPLSPKEQEERKHTNKEWLEQKYWAEGMSLGEVADEAGVDGVTILHWMDKHGIERRESGGRRVDYAYFYTNNHGHEIISSWTSSNGKVHAPVHRLVAVSHHGVDAVKNNHVHHKNGIPWDNRPENLEILSVSEHRSYHAKEMGLSEMGAEATRGTKRD